MHKRKHRKRLSAAVAGAALAPLLAVSLPAGSAHAHGYVSSPPSRQAQCAQGSVSCGEIKYEPQSVEGPKGLSSCSAGNSRFADLDDNAKGWQVTPVGSTATFSWTYTVKHATTHWQYFVGDRKIGEFGGDGKQPGRTTTHQVDFGDLRGQQKVLAVWTIADTPNAFYSCVDVNIG
jgi:chitin-binding protein